MPSTQPFGVSCRGGLNVNLNEFEILSTPGSAVQLKNFEVDPDGGYRRINGYSSYGDIRDDVTPVDVEVKGMQVYKDGLIVTGGNKVYFSYELNGAKQFIPLDNDTDGHALSGSVYLDVTNTSHKTALSYVDQDRAQFTVFSDTDAELKVIVCDGVNKPLLISITGSGDFNTRTITITQINIDAGVNPSTGTVHRGVFVTGGGLGDENNTVYHSSTSTPDVTNFTASGAAISLNDEVVGIKSFRDDIIIFCKNSIFKLINLFDSNSIAIVPITKNVGCLSAFSIQEIGGDLVFLAPDGIRTIAGTARIGDVELSSISRQIQQLLAKVAQQIDVYKIQSCVIRSKSQYRLFYSNDFEETKYSKGIIGTLTANGFEWSETLGIKAYALTSDFDHRKVEQHYHGDDKGYLFNHDVGSSFLHLNSNSNVLEQTNISAVYETPNFDFGELGTRKTLDYIRLSLTPEASATATLKVVFNSGDENTPQPLLYTFPTTSKAGIFGESIFGGSLFGTGQSAIMKKFLQGSGYTASFQIRTDNQDSPFTINGMYINYAPSTRR